MSDSNPNRHPVTPAHLPVWPGGLSGKQTRFKQTPGSFLPSAPVSRELNRTQEHRRHNATQSWLHKTSTSCLYLHVLSRPYYS